MTTASSRLRSAASSSSSRCDSRKGLAVASGTIQLQTVEKDTTARGGTVGKATRNWNSNYNAVKKYVESHNGRYPKNSITDNNLNSWVSTQKRAFDKNNNMNLTQQKITDLEKLPNWRWSKNSHTKQQKSILSSIAASSIAAALSVNTVFPKKGDTKRKIDDNNASDTTIIIKTKKLRISISRESVGAYLDEDPLIFDHHDEVDDHDEDEVDDEVDDKVDDDDDDDKNLFIII